MRAGTSERFEKSKKLVTDGVYRYSRNPMYVGGILILAGLAIFLGNILAFISPILFFLVIDRVVIPIEDEKTAGDLGEEYMEYKKRVREWI
jgi:protein-S-isoprenylcysteine O-methyltransferase Ste14